jgi:DNA primase
MIDIKLARTDYDCRNEVEKCLGEPEVKTRTSWAWKCPFHNDSNPSFTVYENGYNCYGCGVHGDVFDWFSYWQKRPLADVLKEQRIDPSIELERKIEYAKRTQERLQEEIERAQAVLDDLRQNKVWERYHEQIDEFACQWWEHRGIPPEYQGWWKLGYIPDYILGEYHTPAMTMPIFEPGWECVNIRMRLVNPPDEGGKYRPYKSGLPAPLFVADPDKKVCGRTLVVEGEIKSMVSFITAEDSGLQVVGLPGKNPSEKIVEKLKECDPLYLCLDPDADPKPLALKLGKDRVRIIELPFKIDDGILDNGLDKCFMSRLFELARKL